MGLPSEKVDYTIWLEWHIVNPFATTQLGKSLLEDDTYQNDPVLAFAFMQQMSLKAALKQWGSNAEMAGTRRPRWLDFERKIN
jgi:hypothetical protein